MNKNLIYMIARAVYERDPTLEPFDSLTTETKEAYYDQAQAVLEAINRWLADAAVEHP